MVFVQREPENLTIGHEAERLCCVTLLISPTTTTIPHTRIKGRVIRARTYVTSLIG